jgi:ubiquitin
MDIKPVLSIVFISGVLLLAISSCATVTIGPDASLSLGTKVPPRGGELKLLNMDIPQTGQFSADVEYWTTIHFETDVKQEIRRACFNFSGGGQSCVDVQEKDVIYGSHPYFHVSIHVPADSKRIDCYAEYIRGGETRRTNTVTYYVVVLRKPEE